MKALIVGGGKFGTAVIQALIGSGNEVALIDTKEEAVAKAADRFDIQTICGNAVEIELLKSIHISEYDLIVACTDSDEINLLICKFGKDLGCKQSVARVSNPEHVAQTEYLKSSMNIDFTINPDLASATEVFRYLTKKYSLHGGRLISGKSAILECEISMLPSLIGKQIKETGKSLDGMLIAAISRDGQIIVPNGNTLLEENDFLYLTGSEKKLRDIGIRSRNQSTGIKKVMIAGGGRTGFYLASMLERAGVSVKVIEKDPQRCEYLSSVLEHSLVLNADATDINTLLEENIDAQDAFVALTGFDENNILLSLVAKKNGVEDIVTKLSHETYGTLTEDLGVEMIIKPMELSAASLLRAIDTSDNVVFSQIIQGQAEIIEVIAEESMELIGKPLYQQKLPEGAIIASVNRRNEVLVPRGSTIIQPGDRVTILALLPAIPELETLIKRK